MAAHQHLAEGQFHRREGRPNKHEHGSGAAEDEKDSKPGKPHVKVHKAHAPAKRH